MNCYESHNSYIYMYALVGITNPPVARVIYISDPKDELLQRRERGGWMTRLDGCVHVSGA